MLPHIPYAGLSESDAARCPSGAVEVLAAITALRRANANACIAQPCAFQLRNTAECDAAADTAVVDARRGVATWEVVI
jgi:hypothetical protein